MGYVRDLLPEEIFHCLLWMDLRHCYTGIIIFSVGVVGLFSYIYFEEREENPKEYYILLFLATLGAAVLTISRHFVSFFIGLEILSVSLYALIAYLRNRNNAIEVRFEIPDPCCAYLCFPFIGHGTCFIWKQDIWNLMPSVRSLPDKMPGILFKLGTRPDGSG